MSRRFLGVLLALACSKASDGPPPAAPARAVDAGAKPMAIRHEPKAKAPEPTKLQLSEFRKHLREGRKLEKGQRWGEASKEFEESLRAIPMDAMALSELGWSAFQAGDYKRATDANSDAVRMAGDPRIKAASLYNLGRIAEAQGDRDHAARYYARSLALRPHKGVEETLRKLGESPPAGDEIVRNADPPCGDARPLDKVCDCLLSSASDDPPSEGGSCELEESELAAGFRVAVATRDRTDDWFLVERAGDGWRVVGQFASAYNPGMAGIEEEFELGDAKLSSVAGHRVLAIQGSHSRSDKDSGINEVEVIDQKQVTVCAIGGATEPTRCPFTIPVSYAYDRSVLIELPPEEEAQIDHTPGIPIARKAKLAWNIGDDGVLTVTLAEGAAPEYLRPWLGPHKLW